MHIIKTTCNRLFCPFQTHITKLNLTLLTFQSFYRCSNSRKRVTYCCNILPRMRESLSHFDSSFMLLPCAPRKKNQPKYKTPNSHDFTQTFMFVYTELVLYDFQFVSLQTLRTMFFIQTVCLMRPRTICHLPHSTHHPLTQRSKTVTRKPAAVTNDGNFLSVSQ